MHDKLFEAALGINAPWAVSAVNFDESARLLTVDIDFKPGSRFAVPGHDGLHPVHDTVIKRYRHLNFFQHECVLQVRTPRAKLPDGSVRLVEPDFAGKLSGFTLLFEALILMLAAQMPFTAVARIVGESVHRVMQVCRRYVELALESADFSEVKALAIDETSRARGHDYITLAADAVQRRVLFVTEGREAKTIKALAGELQAHGCAPGQIESVSSAASSPSEMRPSQWMFSASALTDPVLKMCEPDIPPTAILNPALPSRSAMPRMRSTFLCGAALPIMTMVSCEAASRVPAECSGFHCKTCSWPFGATKALRDGTMSRRTSSPSEKLETVEMLHAVLPSNGSSAL